MPRIISTSPFRPAPFRDEVHDMGDYVQANPGILGDDVRIISRELEHGPDGRRLDFLVYDMDSNQPGLVELKKDIADEKILLQTLRYADWLRSNQDTIRYQISRLNLDVDPEDMEGDIKIYIVAPRIMPVVAELAQYIQGFEFEFIQLERFEDASKGFVSVVSPLEVPNRTAPRTRARLEHDWESYSTRGVAQERIDLLVAAVSTLADICNEEAWELAPRKLRNAVRFQTGGGRNVFAIAIRKRDDHQIRFCLGPNFEIDALSLPDSVRNAIKHKPNSRWWAMPLQTVSINEYRDLLGEAYSFVTGSG